MRRHAETRKKHREQSRPPLTGREQTRQAPPAQGAEHDWLHHHRERWASSGQPWDAYLRGWAGQEGLHQGTAIVAALDGRFVRRFHAEGPYLFADLAATTEAEEQAAIDAGQIQACGIRYVATTPGRHPG